ncbi:hypothetical protein NMY22_g10262 [Coprinellus aureogranulatus]|nr:hypothetical protein NMY22_g10262 [Coprinellus aureogranulatus]
MAVHSGVPQPRNIPLDLDGESSWDKGGYVGALPSPCQGINPVRALENKQDVTTVKQCDDVQGDADMTTDIEHLEERRRLISGRAHYGP